MLSVRASDLEDEIVDGSQRRSLRKTPRYPVDLLLPGPVLEPPDDSDDAPSGPAVLVVPPTHVSETDFEDPYDDGFSNGEGVDNGSALHGGHTTGETRRGSLNGEQRQITTTRRIWSLRILLGKHQLKQLSRFLRETVK